MALEQAFEQPFGQEQPETEQLADVIQLRSEPEEALTPTQAMIRYTQRLNEMGYGLFGSDTHHYDDQRRIYTVVDGKKVYQDLTPPPLKQ